MNGPLRLQPGDIVMDPSMCPAECYDTHVIMERYEQRGVRMVVVDPSAWAWWPPCVWMETMLVLN